VAFIEKRPSGWRAQVRRIGSKSISRTFDLRKDAEAWATEIEREIRRGNLAVIDAASNKLTFNDCADQYAAGPLATLRSRKTSELYLQWARKRFGPKFVTAIRSADVAKWRDALISEGVSARSVAYSLSILSTVLTFAQQELSVSLPGGNPVRAVRKPAPPKGRDRRLLPGELDALLRAADQSRAVGLRQAIELAVETTMRLSEIIYLQWRHVDLFARTAHLPETKNGESRTVALSSAAVTSLSGLNVPSKRRGPVFGNWGTKFAFEKAWAKCRKSALETYLEECANDGTAPDPAFLSDLRFHDLRHEATSRLFERGLGIMEVASMTGHKSLSMLKRYTHVEASNLAKKLG
jgi:integrase